MISKIIGLVLIAPLLIMLIGASMYHQQHISAIDALASASLLTAIIEAFGVGLYLLFK